MNQSLPIEPIPIKIHKLALRTRLFIKRLAKSRYNEWKNPYAIRPKNLNGGCAVASYTLWKLLKNKGYDAHLICKLKKLSGHCWIEVDGYVLDITASQFPGYKQAVYSVPQCDVHDSRYWWDWHNYDIFRDDDAVNEINCWVDAQSPIHYQKEIDQFIERISNEN